MLNKKIQVDEIVLSCAVRYAIGRKSYVPSIIIEQVKNNWHFLSSNIQNAIIRDIYNCDDYGYDDRAMDWLHLLRLITPEIKEKDVFNPENDKEEHGYYNWQSYAPNVEHSDSLGYIHFRSKKAYDDYLEDLAKSRSRDISLL